jgi:alpha-D-ribose 1-methylphosphonate 5-triphosphate synthase subunit PhnI
VIYHTEGADSWGSVNSLKLPAHVEFASDLNLLRAAVERKLARDAEKAAAAASHS